MSGRFEKVPLYGVLRWLKHFARSTFYIFISRFLSKRWSSFDDAVYKGRRIIIIGPAETSLTYLDGKVIDDFDIVIRINKSPKKLAGLEASLGSRTDYLYHCCDEDERTGGGVIDLDVLRSQGNRAIVYTYAEKKLEYNFFRSVLKYPDAVFLRTGADLYLSLKHMYKAPVPTTGLQAVYHVMSADFAELHVTGFTFFRTPYVGGYRSSAPDSASAYALAVSKSNHDPDDELRLFGLMLDKAEKASQKVFVDSTLAAIISQYRQENHEQGR